MALLPDFSKRLRQAQDAQENNDDPTRAITGFLKQRASNALLFSGIGIVGFIVLFFILDRGGSFLDTSRQNAEVVIPPPSIPSDGVSYPPIAGFELTHIGPVAVENTDDIRYTISYTYDETIATVPLADITIYDIIPTNVTLVEADGSWQIVEGAVAWSLSERENASPLSITFSPNGTDIEVTNDVFAQAYGEGSGGSGGTLGDLLPASPTFSARTDAEQQAIADTIRGLPDLVAAYQQAEAATGIPWQVLAGLHYREGSLNPNNSLVSGRPIGTNEPDIVAGGGCLPTYTPGEPVALSGGGCGFRTFADSAIFAANHLKGKNKGSIPTTFPSLAEALSYYNGGGNANCGKTPYANCPPEFIGDDDTYVMSLFDARHEEMYIVYCADYTLCNPPRRDQRLGVASVIMGLSRFY